MGQTCTGQLVIKASCQCLDIDHACHEGTPCDEEKWLHRKRLSPFLLLKAIKSCPDPGFSLPVASGLVSGLDKWSLHVHKGKEEE